ncbi:hypothetical protein [Cognatishimia activa]|uniref:Uncharacterized protein n=1 Tax=Cognatishimia activa TaxID=1715691 RepID=A0A0P1ITD6_9RHOB|nr:hypothetical protein [Cognatishimia activa]CUI26140.1 hypothetical protein TA5113_00001 [Cognatishimia activa]CUK25187.1 hypothetical protein TA5114_00978 [Cognatishimia activa]
MSKSSRLKDLKKYDAFRRLNQAKLKQINDIFVEVQIAKTALRSLSDTIDQIGRAEPYEHEVPSTKSSKVTVIRRKPSYIKKLIRSRIEEREALHSLVFAISLTESYLTQALETVLCAHPQKILISVKGNQSGSNSSKSVTLEQVIKSASIDDIVYSQAEQRVKDAMYARPAQYIQYVEKVLGFGLPEGAVFKFVESKATRDLYVHGDGTINEVYVGKVNDLARGSIGEKATLEDEYFEECIAAMKQIFSAIYRGLLGNFGNCDRVSRVLENQNHSSI